MRGALYSIASPVRGGMVNGVIHSGGETLLHKNDTIFQTSGDHSGTATLRPWAH
jgi:hypothetical protein